MKKILVTGGDGQVGSEFQFLAASFPQFQFLFTNSQNLDITNQQSVNDYFSTNKPDFCVNCAAHTAVDKAESEVALSRKINVEGVVNLAKACAAHDTTLIHLSTDYVYHSLTQNRPFVETDAVNPKGVYAETKLIGENEAIKHCEKTIIVRTSWVYSTFGHNFVKTMLRLAKDRSELNVVIDQIGTPTYARDLAQAIAKMIEKIATDAVDTQLLRGAIFNYSNEGVTSWYDFAQAIFDERGLSVRVHPILTAAYPTPAKRPPFSLMDKTKFKNTFNVTIPHWRDALRRCLAALAQ
jgi:dTDP-4-dehydrorhamnose reductase